MLVTHSCMHGPLMASHFMGTGGVQKRTNASSIHWCSVLNYGLYDYGVGGGGVSLRPFFWSSIKH